MPEIKDQIVARIGFLNLSVYLRILDINNRITAKNLNIRNEMLPNNPRYLLRKPYLKRRSVRNKQTGNRPTGKHHS